MRIARVGGRAALVRGEALIDIEGASRGRFPANLNELYGRWTELREWAAALGPDAGAEEHHRAKGPLEMPIEPPRQVFAIGANYADHVAESGSAMPEMPLVFTKFPACLVGPDTPVPLPTSRVDWEVELVVVMARETHRVGAEDAWSHVAGVCVGQDLSERPLQLMGTAAQFSLGKSFPGFGPVGPYLVTTDELADPDDLAIGCSVNGEVMQQGRTGDMVFSVPELISYLSAISPLLPGDVVFTGTPAGVGVFRSPRRYLRPGEVLESWIEGLGSLRSPMTEGPAFDWRAFARSKTVS
ncbi:fumarylacetoacetate hydrolase family protein [Streptomyces sp. NPDC051985]|uniref:fumarylacetoacetate hydrolase family protein n=1 Tax=Streptomyces sp. NPDC051985 TaxID=3155807 RepID=UPI00342A2E0A